MLILDTRHLKTGEELMPQEISALIEGAIELKEARKVGRNREWLKGKQLALLFDKPSLRTRFSFTIAMAELGGFSIESAAPTRKHEEPEDLARVLGGYCHGIMIRTHEDSFIERMAEASKVPVINGLSQLHHPCQILADLMTLKEIYGNLKGLTLSYVGDGNNILHSLLIMAPSMGMNVRYSCPKEYQPDSLVLKKAKALLVDPGHKITRCDNPRQAVQESNAVYTDVWTSMGFESEKNDREEAFEGFQVNEELMKGAAKDAVFMHCLPMARGKEVSQTLPDRRNSVIFQQSENRLHVQKALLVGLMADKG
jgi:ornithine carbamoyltransferase